MIYKATSAPHRCGRVSEWAPPTNEERLAAWVVRKYHHDEAKRRAEMLEIVREILSPDSY